MKRIPATLLRRMAAQLTENERDEMAIPSYLHRNPLLRWMAWRRLEVIAQWLERLDLTGCVSDRAIMDFGCGTGTLLDASSRHAGQIYGVDIKLDAARMLIAEWGLSGIRLLEPVAAQNEIVDKSLDVILAAEVLEHIDPLAPTLAFFHRALKPSGSLLVSLPTENTFYRIGRRIAGFDGHYHNNDAASIHSAITKCGFALRAKRTIPPIGGLAIYWIIEYRKTLDR